MKDSSYETIIHRVELLLEEWGQCQRNEPNPVNLGYPSMSVEARMMKDYGRKSGDKRRRAVWQRNRRWDKTNGKRHRVVVLAPEKAQKDGKQGTKTSADWPEHVMAVDQIIACMPRPLIGALVRYFIGHESTRVAAQAIGISRQRFEGRLESARWYIAGRIEQLDESA